MRFYSSLQELPAYNWVLFECYYTLHCYISRDHLKDEMDFISKLGGYIGRGDTDDLKRLMDARWQALLRSENNMVPYVYFAYDCLLHEATDIINEDSSFSFDNVPAGEVLNSINDIYQFFNIELTEIFEDSSLFREQIANDRKNFFKEIEALKKLDLKDQQAINDYAESILMHRIDTTDIPDFVRFKDKYLKSISFTLDSLNFMSLNDLKNISTFDYYTKLVRRHEEYTKQKELQNKMKR